MKLGASIIFSIVLSSTLAQAKGGCGGGMFKEAERLELLAEAAKKNRKTAQEKALRKMAALQRQAVINGHESVDWDAYDALKEVAFPIKKKSAPDRSAFENFTLES